MNDPFDHEGFRAWLSHLQREGAKVACAVDIDGWTWVKTLGDTKHAIDSLTTIEKPKHIFNCWLNKFRFLNKPLKNLFHSAGIS